MTRDLSTTFTLAGVLAGYFSLGRILFGDIRNWYRNPRLEIEFDPSEDLKEWTLRERKRLQKVATVYVRNKRRVPASRCVAILKLVAAPTHALLPQKEFALHWADTDYSGYSYVAEPVEIGIERRRLDVAFTFTAARESSRGAWVAIPLALSNTGAAPQA